MIKTENLSMVFTTEEVQTKALNEVNIEVKQGEFVAIMGPSGCGKSTLLNILGTLDSPTSGKYFFNGKEIDKMGESQLTAFRKGNIGFVFQSFNLIDELTVFENVELPLVYLGCRKAERKRKVMEVLDRMNIAHRADIFRSQLSGGQPATCGDSARRGDGLSADPCRRTDGKPGFDKRGGGDGITSRTERAGDDDRHGHALGTGCQLRTPDYPSFGRPGRFLNIHL